TAQKHCISALTPVVPLHMTVVPAGVNHRIVGIPLRGPGAHTPDPLPHAEQQFVVLPVSQIVDARYFYRIDFSDLKIDVAQYGEGDGTHHDFGLAGCAFLKMERVSSTFFLYRPD